MSEATEDLVRLTTAVERALSRNQALVSVTETEVLSEEDRRNLVVRCSIAGGHGLPDSVLVKQARGDYDAANLAQWDSMRLLRDWLGAEFLSAVAPGEHAPRWLGGDRELGLVILEDLGSQHESLVQPLLGSDASAGERALTALATRLGRMHAQCASRLGEYERLARALHPDLADELAKARDTDARVAPLCERLRAILPVSVEAEREFRDALRAVSNQGAFYTFIHGDCCPDNVFTAGDALKLIDFEFARLGSALVDGSYFRMTFPTCWCANRIPDAAVARLESAYRKELSQGCEAARDDARFGAALCDACAHWVFVTLEWLLERALVEDGDWGIGTNRARILARLDSFVRTAAEFASYPALGDLCASLLAALRARWPDAEPLPLYPAFR